MILNYTTFRIQHPDGDAFDEWFSGLCRAAREEDGCVVYDYFRMVEYPGRRAVLAAWRDQEAFDAHRVHPLHVEMLALGASKWGISDLRSNSWPDANGYRTSARDRVDAIVPGQGREAMVQLATQFNESHTQSGPGNGSPSA